IAPFEGLSSRAASDGEGTREVRGVKCNHGVWRSFGEVPSLGWAQNAIRSSWSRCSLEHLSILRYFGKVNPAAYELIGFAVGVAIVLVLAILFRGKRGSEPQIATRLESLERGQEREERIFRDELARTREESAGAAKSQREELSGALKNVTETTVKSLTEISGMLRAQLDQVTRQARRLTDNVDARLKELREENSRQIEKMRATVDEKLHDTLE